MAPKPLAQRVASMSATKPSDAAAASAISKFDSAFVTVASSKRSAPETEDNMLPDIRNWSHADRQMLSGGVCIKIIDANSQQVAEIPLALFRTISTKAVKAELSGGTVLKLSSGVQTWAVKELIKYLKDITTWKKYVKDIHTRGSMTSDLQLCSAAEALGLDMYTQKLFNYYWGRIKAGDLPGYGDIDGICATDTPLGHTIFQKVADALGNLAFENRIPDPEDFAEYLATNARLREAVDERKERLRRRQEYQERQAKREEVAALRKAADDEWEKQRAEFAKKKAAKQQAKWDAAKKKEADLAARVKAKLAEPGKKKWKADEALYLERIYGKKVPI